MTFTRVVVLVVVDEIKDDGEDGGLDFAHVEGGVFFPDEFVESA